MPAANNKVRLVLMIREELRDALHLEAALSARYMGEVLESLIETHLPEAVKQIHQRRLQHTKAKRGDAAK